VHVGIVVHKYGSRPIILSITLFHFNRLESAL